MFAGATACPAFFWDLAFAPNLRTCFAARLAGQPIMSGAFGWRNAVAYGLMGLPLAFAALPLYVILPNHYARQFGVPLAALGAVLLGARLLDALID